MPPARRGPASPSSRDFPNATDIRPGDSSRSPLREMHREDAYNLTVNCTDYRIPRARSRQPRLDQSTPASTNAHFSPYPVILIFQSMHAREMNHSFYFEITNARRDRNVPRRVRREEKIEMPARYLLVAIWTPSSVFVDALHWLRKATTLLQQERGKTGRF